MIVAALLGAATFVYRTLSFTGFPNDHFVHLAAAQQIVLGALPVRDFVERGLPLMELVSAGAQMAGQGLRSEMMLVAFAFAFAAVFTMAAVYTASRSLILAMVLTAASVLIYPVSYAYPKLLTYAAALVAAGAYAAVPRPSRAVLLGVVGAVAFLFRHDHGVLIVGAASILMLARHGLSLLAVRRSVIVTGVALLIASPFLVWVQIHEGLRAYVSDGIRFSAREAERSAIGGLPTFSIDRSKPMFHRLGQGALIHVRWQPGLPDDQIRLGERRHDLVRRDPMGPLSWQYEIWSWSPGALESLVRDPQVADTDGIDRSTFRLKSDHPPPLIDSVLVRLYGPDEGLRLRANGVALIFYLAWALPLSAIVMLVWRWRRLADVIRAPAAMAIALLLAMNLTLLRDPLDLRVRDVIVPVCVLGGCLLGLAWHARVNTAARLAARLLATAVAVAFAITCGAIGDGPQRLEQMHARDGWSGAIERKHEIDRQLAAPNERTGEDLVSPAYRSLSDYISQCTPPDSRILALTFAPEVFFYSGRGFAGGQPALTAGYYKTDRDAEIMLVRVSKENVPLVLMDSETATEMAQGYPRIVDYVRSRYHEISRTTIGKGKEFILLAENTRKSQRMFGRGRLPCFAS